MARIRSIKPEFWTDEKLSPCDPLTRLVFLGLISLADDAGRLSDSVKLLDGQLFAETEDSVREPLARLSRMSRIVRGTTKSGQRIIQIVNWHHQKIDHPNLGAALPPIVNAQPVEPEGVAVDSRDVREPFANDSRDVREPRATLSVSVSVPRSGSGSGSGSENGAYAPDDDGSVTASRHDVTPLRHAGNGAAIDAVLACYLSHHPKRRPGDKDRTAITRALRTYTADELCEAIQGNASDSWHASKGKHELTYVLRDNGHIDTARAQFSALRTTTTNGTTHVPPASSRGAILWPLYRRYGLTRNPNAAERERIGLELVAAGVCPSVAAFEAEFRVIQPHTLADARTDHWGISQIDERLAGRTP